MMKKIRTTLSLMALACMASLAMMSCDKPSEKPSDPESVIDDPENAVVMSQGYGIYKGDEYKSGSTQFSLVLYSDNLIFNEDKWTFKGSGEFLWFEVNAKKPANENRPDIATGTYNPVDFETTYPLLTFVSGIDGGMGSFFASVVDGVETQDPIIDGTLRVGRVGSKHKFIVEVKTKSGRELVYKYENDIKIVKFGVAIPPEPFDGKFVGAQLTYYGDYYKKKFGNYILELTTIPKGAWVGGYILGFDINAALIKSQSEMGLATGKYSIDYGQVFNKPMTFNAGYPVGNDIYGSYWIDINSEGGQQRVSTIDDGEFTITDNGDGTVKITVHVELDDKSIREGVFQSELKIFDGTCLSRMDGDVNLTKFTQAMMVFRGDLEYTATSSYNWAVMLASDGIDLEKMTGFGDMMQFDLNTPITFTTELPEGTFNVIEKINNESIKPFTYIPGYFDRLREMPIGTWYRRDLFYTAPGVSGTITVAKQAGGAGYDISFSMHDDYHYRLDGNKIEGSYSGPLTFFDATIVPQAAPRAFAPKVAPSASAKRTLKALH